MKILTNDKKITVRSCRNK